jgi:hypothetical protein
MRIERENKKEREREEKHIKIRKYSFFKILLKYEITVVPIFGIIFSIFVDVFVSFPCS